MKKLLFCCGLLVATVSVQAAALFSDDFNAYANGDLAGQGPWLQNGSSDCHPSADPQWQGNARVQRTGPERRSLSSPFSLVDGTSFYIGATHQSVGS